MSHMIEGFEAGGVDFLFKPLHPYVTKAKVSAFVRFYRQKKELEKAHRYVLKINQELEERVKERTKELTRINNDLDNFIYTASHDLKAPISNMEGLMHILYDMLSEATKNDEDIFKVRRLIDESIERFKSTLVDLTEVAKAQSEEVSDNSRVEFKEMLEEIKFSIKDLIEESGAIIHEDFSQVPHIVFSRKNLRSIIYNLISNAIKYRAKERVSEVFIKTSTVENFIVLTVKDNGLGIKKEDFEKVFGIFKRLHTHVEGTGVGMSIVKKIVENNGGKIEIQSTVGEGTTFKIFLKEE
jgi:two-component system, sensor histidine kinase and response regulator